MGLYDRDYMRKRGERHPSTTTAIVAILGILAVAFALGLARSCGHGLSDYRARRAGSNGVTNAHTPLGVFEISPGKVAITSPGYSGALVLGGRIARLMEGVHT